MAIVKMSKLKLVGIKSHKDAILNTLSKTDSVEIVATQELDNTTLSGENKIDSLHQERARAEKCVEYISSVLDKNKKQPFYPADSANVLSHFFLSFDEFIETPKTEVLTRQKIDNVLRIEERLIQNGTERVQSENALNAISPYASLTEPFSVFEDTKTTNVHLGLIRPENVEKLKTALANYPLTHLSIEKGVEQVVALVISLKEYGAEINSILAESGFSACPYKEEVTAQEKIDEIKAKLIALDEEGIALEKQICENYQDIKEIKIYADYLKFLIEKNSVSENFRTTQKTFILQAYVPTFRVDAVKEAVEKVTDGAVFIEVSEPTEEDEPPTMLKNNPIVRPTEFITEMYSMPSYRELDPSKIVFFFFMLFMGVIMADVGYGFLMVAVGALLASRIKVDNGAKRIWQIVSISGVFAAIFGVLFNSYFGASLPYSAVIPSPVPSGNGTADMMTVLLLCLLLGVIHIGTGYLFKAINDFRRKDILAGIFDGLIWVIFFIGFIFASFNFIVGYLIPEVSMDTPLFKFFGAMQMPGVYMAAGAVGIAALTAGRSEKGLGKFTKGFGAVYGIINILSDILSYARLFGLLLSGMIIATTFNDMGVGLMAGGGVGYVLGPVVIVIGHIFNVAMNVLGAYIHDSRLQYIEFFSKFYNGEGRKFVPFGSEFEFIYLTKK